MYNNHVLKNAFIMDYWDRGTVSEFGWVLRYFAHRIGEDNLEFFDFSREFYEKIAKVADSLVVEALLAKKAIKAQKKELEPEIVDPQDLYAEMKKMDMSKVKREYVDVEPSRIAPSVIDDFVEIMISMKHLGLRANKLDELEKERDEYESEEDL